MDIEWRDDAGTDASSTYRVEDKRLREQKQTVGLLAGFTHAERYLFIDRRVALRERLLVRDPFMFSHLQDSAITNDLQGGGERRGWGGGGGVFQVLTMISPWE